MNSAKKEDEPTLESLFFNNLVLLGFNIKENEFNNRMKFHKEMFRSTNPKAMEIIFSFLFKLLDPKRSEKDFKGCWPVTNQKEASQFRSVALTWLEELKDSGILPYDCVRKSLLLSCCGERFTALAFHFSTHVMKRLLTRNFPSFSSQNLPPFLEVSDSDPSGLVQRFVAASHPTAASSLTKKGFNNLLEEMTCAKNLFKLHIESAVTNFLEFSKETVVVEKEWKHYSKKLLAQHNEHEDDEQQYAQQRNQFDIEHQSEVTKMFADDATIMRKEQKKLMKSAWKELEKHYHEFKETRNIVNEILTLEIDKTKLDGKEILLKSGQTKEELMEGEETLSLTKLLNKCNACMAEYSIFLTKLNQECKEKEENLKENLEFEDREENNQKISLFFDTNKMRNLLQEQCDAQAKTHKRLKEFNQNLDSTLEDMKKSTQTLEDTIKLLHHQNLTEKHKSKLTETQKKKDRGFLEEDDELNYLYESPDEADSKKKKKIKNEDEGSSENSSTNEINEKIDDDNDDMDDLLQISPKKNSNSTPTKQNYSEMPPRTPTLGISGKDFEPQNVKTPGKKEISSSNEQSLSSPAALKRIQDSVVRKAKKSIENAELDQFPALPPHLQVELQQPFGEFKAPKGNLESVNLKKGSPLIVKQNMDIDGTSKEKEKIVIKQYFKEKEESLFSNFEKLMGKSRSVLDKTNKKRKEPP